MGREQSQLFADGRFGQGPPELESSPVMLSSVSAAARNRWPRNWPLPESSFCLGHGDSSRFRCRSGV